jgi:chaperonin GroES
VVFLREPPTLSDLNGGFFMSVPIMPLADYVVAVAEEAESKTASGLYLPEAAKEKPKTAKIVAVGKAVQELKVGDKIIYKSYSTTEVKVSTTEYILVKEEDVLATVK